mgnify:CR=1 FL=1|tara:strand:- start:1483 stop:2016 length:534 start_codon:yes stop_codon:yes gene_type:complete
MSYFNYFPLLAYDIDGSRNYKLVTDIIKRVKIRSAIKDGTLIFDNYDVKYGENPEDVAYKYYDNSEYHWVVLMVNNIADRYYEWPLTDPQFQLFLTDKYGAGNEDSIHHYELAQTSGPTSSSDDSHMLEVNSDTENATAITNREYEEREQNQLRQIRLLDRRYITQFVEEFENLMRE